jgi:hypothetical protein
MHEHGCVCRGCAHGDGAVVISGYGGRMCMTANTVPASSATCMHDGPRPSLYGRIAVALALALAS